MVNIRVARNELSGDRPRGADLRDLSLLRKVSTSSRS